MDNSTFSAEYGRNSGAIVNIATRSGTNQFSGEAFEFYRNDRVRLAERLQHPPDAEVAIQPQPVRRGARRTIVRNRTFFFVTYEGLRQRQGIDINSGVLTTPNAPP